MTTRSHQDRNHTGATSKLYRDNYDKIFYQTSTEVEEDKWEIIVKNGKSIYKKKK